MKQSFETVGIVGGGLMGSGIAAKFAMARYRVRVFDVSLEARMLVHTACHTAFMEMASAGRLADGDIRTAQSMIEDVDTLHGLEEAEFVIEAVSESLVTKRKVYSELEDILSSDAIIASTTSSFVPEELISDLRRPAQFLVAHFWNPPHLLPLVEVVPSVKTSRNTLDATTDILFDAHCQPVTLSKSIAGFIGNRIQFAILREALHLVRSGVADASTIDAIVKQTIGARYAWAGPLESADLGGLKTFLEISSWLMPKLAKDEDVLEILRGLVDDGELGQSSGKGLYCWDATRNCIVSNSRIACLRLSASKNRV